jgi:mono/diheme cytochrome c family protein
MRRLQRIIFTVLFGTAVSVLPMTAADAGSVARGRYLVVEVGKCGDCHTPHLPTGAPDMSKWLKGSPLGVKPVATVPGWADAAPDLTADSFLWKSWTPQAAEKFFTTGKTPDGKVAAPPMPAYTLTATDARAIVAYLKSLK